VAFIAEVQDAALLCWDDDRRVLVVRLWFNIIADAVAD
jgi:hypothetical protein